MGGACGTNGSRGEVRAGLWWAHLRGKDILEEQARWKQNRSESCWGAMDWIDLAFDREKWAFVNTVMKLGVA
jgi:hypothetical protein